MSSCASHTAKRRLFKDAGRACPIDYRISPSAFAGEATASTDVLYVVGGLYGNPFALDALDALLAEEDGAALAVFNGDAHWFDKTAENFALLEDRLAKHTLLVGNVEAELRRQTDVGVGCGCAYPECTSDESVSRSNRIHKMLSIAVDQHPELKDRLQGRPATMVVNVGPFRVGITHGDEKLIGGWDCSRESLQDVMRQDELDRFMANCHLDVFATTHTCAPAALTLARGAVINNGAAGLPNFKGQHFGLVTRIAETSHPDALFGCCLDGLYVQLVPVRYDHAAYLEWFDGLWGRLSPAAISYRARIVDGAEDRMEDSLLGGFSLEAAGKEEQSRYTQRFGKPRATREDVDLALAKLLYFEDMLDDPDHLRTVANPATLQLNVTARCNLACAHCHVGSNPHRTEHMGKDVLNAAFKVAKDRGIETIDITGGAPEMHPDFEWLLREAAAAAPHGMVRSNLVILQDPAYARYLDLYAELGVEVVASLPNVFAAQANTQRGHGAFDAVLDIIRQLNDRGYGQNPDRVLNLVFNPQEPVLPPVQADLEEMYRRRLRDLGVSFTGLFAVANNPIGRYGAHLMDSGCFEAYLDLLMDAFNPQTCANMMCRHQLSVGWDGTVYDCDFNQALGLKAAGVDGAALTIFDYAEDPTKPLGRPIAFGNHCYACTAGFGSSCGGTLVQS